MFKTHTLIYTFVFISSFIFSYYTNYISYKIFGSIILGWSIFGLTSIGHELYHLDNLTIPEMIIGYLCLDLWSVRKSVWIRRHNKFHHHNVYDDGEDEHLIDGSIIKNIKHTIIILIKTYELLDFSLYNYLLILFRIYFFNLISWYSIIISYSVIIFCVTFFTFITHSAPIISSEENYKLKQLHRSVDIFPDSELTILIMGGFNVHSCHHFSPKSNRDKFSKLHKFLKSEYGENHRVINNFKELYNLYK